MVCTEISLEVSFTRTFTRHWFIDPLFYTKRRRVRWKTCSISSTYREPQNIPHLYITCITNYGPQCIRIADLDIDAPISLPPSDPAPCPLCSFLFLYLSASLFLLAAPHLCLPFALYARTFRAQFAFTFVTSPSCLMRFQSFATIFAGWVVKEAQGSVSMRKRTPTREPFPSIDTGSLRGVSIVLRVRYLSKSDIPGLAC